MELTSRWTHFAAEMAKLSERFGEWTFSTIASKRIGLLGENLAEIEGECFLADENQVSPGRRLGPIVKQDRKKEWANERKKDASPSGKQSTYIYEVTTGSGSGRGIVRHGSRSGQVAGLASDLLPTSRDKRRSYISNPRFDIQ